MSIAPIYLVIKQFYESNFLRLKLSVLPFLTNKRSLYVSVFSFLALAFIIFLNKALAFISLVKVQYWFLANAFC